MKFLTYTLIMKNSAIPKNYTRLSILIALIFFVTDLNAQKKISLDVNVGTLHSVGKDVLKRYNSNVNPLQIEYFSRKKYEKIYFNTLLNLNYFVNRNISLGLESGIYLHFSERYFGITKRTSVSVPLLATFRMNLINIKTDQLGINIAGGKNFFNIDAGYDKIKNGTIINASAFYLINKKNIIKLGIEKNVDNGTIYFIAQTPSFKNETFTYHLNRLSIILSYGFIFK